MSKYISKVGIPSALIATTLALGGCGNDMNQEIKNYIDRNSFSSILDDISNKTNLDIDDFLYTSCADRHGKAITIAELEEKYEFGGAEDKNEVIHEFGTKILEYYIVSSSPGIGKDDLKAVSVGMKYNVNGKFGSDNNIIYPINCLCDGDKVSVIPYGNLAREIAYVTYLAGEKQLKDSEDADSVHTCAGAYDVLKMGLLSNSKISSGSDSLVFYGSHPGSDDKYYYDAAVTASINPELFKMVSNTDFIKFGPKPKPHGKK